MIESYVWVVWLTGFFIFEAWALVTRSSHETITLTCFIEHHFPRWFLACFLGWLCYHFLIDTPALH
jgi:hypothetical protein